MKEEEVILLANQFFDIENKIKARSLTFLDRNFSRINSVFENSGFTVLNPIGEKYKETRTDVEAHITSDRLDQLKIIEVLKPIIYKNEDTSISLIQKGNVIVG